MKYISNNSYLISNSDFISLLPNIIDNKEELLKYVAKNGDLIRYLPEESRIDIDVIMQAMKMIVIRLFIFLIIFFQMRKSVCQ